MNEKEIQFRTAAFGGFQKQDVLDYLDHIAQEQTEKLNGLQRRLEEAEQARDAAAKGQADLEGRAKQLEAELSQVSSQLTQEKARLAAAEQKSAALSAQVEELAAQVRRLMPGAQAYDALKERAAGIELAAHGRAQEIEEEARVRARKTGEEAAAWLGRLMASYETLRAGLNDAVARAGQEMERVNASLTGLGETFEAEDAALQELQRSVGASLNGPKAPEPLPLEEELK